MYPTERDMCYLLLALNSILLSFVWEFGGEGKEGLWGEKYIVK